MICPYLQQLALYLEWGFGRIHPPQDMPEWQQQICHSIQYTEASCCGSYFKSGPWNEILDIQ